MRKVISGTFVTMDGVMQGPGAPEEDRTGGFAFGGWTVDYWDEPMGEWMDGLLGRPFDLLLGRRTYEIFEAYWPYQEGSEIGEKFNACTKFVATSSDEPLAWVNSVALRGDVPGEVAALKQADGPDLLIQGSGVLIRSLLAEGLIDELSLMSFPVVLGTGKRLFGGGTVPAALKMVDSKISTSGVMMGRYVPEGPVHTGSFATQPPSEAELARRERWKREEGG